MLRVLQVRVCIPIVNWFADLLHVSRTIVIKTIVMHCVCYHSCGDRRADETADRIAHVRKERGLQALPVEQPISGAYEIVPEKVTCLS